MREDERHVKVPGFWRNISLPIRPEITWSDLTLPVCLSTRETKRGEWEDRRTVRQRKKCEKGKMKLKEREMEGGGGGHVTCQWDNKVYLMKGCLCIF